MKLKGSMEQAVTKVNVLSLVIFNVGEVDALFHGGKQHHPQRQWQDGFDSPGVLGNGMFQDGLYVNLGDLHCSATRIERRYAKTSLKGQGLADDYAEVGLEGSTLSEIRTRTWGSVQQIDVSFSTYPVNPRRLCA